MSAVTKSPAETPILVASQETCVTCGSAGTILYSNLSDQLFSAPGEWNLRRCNDASCGLIWLDPMPHQDELGRFYQTYYTHASKPAGTAKPERTKSKRRLKVVAQEGYLANRFGYFRQERSWLTRLLGWTFWLTPVRRMHLDFSLMHLQAVPNGRVLDVGCGGGQILSNLQQHGWTVEGVDFDPQAVAAARERGVQVRLGGLADQDYPAGTFDAVIMSHLIEHVPDPAELIRECHRILKPGGRLVIVTPNPQSLSHRLFGRAWRGLEPPRHLFIQTRNSLGKLTRTAGFSKVSLETSARFAEGMFRQAFELRRLQAGGTRQPFPGQKTVCRVLEFFEIILLSVGARAIGEEHVCIATKELIEPAISSPLHEGRRAA